MSELYNKQFEVAGKTFETSNSQELWDAAEEANIEPILELVVPNHIMALGEDSPEFQEWMEEQIRQFFAKQEG